MPGRAICSRRGEGAALWVSTAHKCRTATGFALQFFDYQEPTIGASFLQQSITLDYATIKFEVRMRRLFAFGTPAPADTPLQSLA